MPQRVSDILRSPPPSLPLFLIPGLLPEQGHLIIGGKWAIGKTLLNLELISSLVRGVPFLGIFPVSKPRRVLLVQAEMPGATFISERIMPLANISRNGVFDNFYLEQSTTFRLTSGMDTASLIKVANSCSPEFVSVDPLYSIHVGSFNEAGVVNETLQCLNYISLQTKSAVNLVAHFRKAFRTNSGKKLVQDADDIIGSSFFANWADAIITIIPLEEETENTLHPLRQINFDKTRWIFPLGSLTARIYMEPPFIRPDKLSPNLRILQALHTGSNTASAISKRASTNYKYTQEILEALVRKGILTLNGGDYAFAI